MTYELAKELKDGGFPSECWEITSLVGAKVEAMTPTLSELIEACGEGRLLLERCYDTAKSGLDVVEYWIAQQGMNREQGATPEEAVARLWLALNKLSNH